MLAQNQNETSPIYERDGLVDFSVFMWYDWAMFIKQK